MTRYKPPAKKKRLIKLSKQTKWAPLRKEYLKVQNWRRTEKAVSALRKFIGHHMKSENVKIGKEVNEFLWHHGIRNPPHHLKVNAVKDKEGKVMIELFGVKKKEPKENKKAQ